MQPQDSTAGAAAKVADDERLYDVVVVGAGPIGQAVADRTRAAGLTVTEVWLRLLEAYRDQSSGELNGVS